MTIPIMRLLTCCMDLFFETCFFVTTSFYVFKCQ